MGDLAFAPILLASLPVQTVGFLAERACEKFSWGVPSTQVRLYLVPSERARDVERDDALTVEEILGGAFIFSGDTLSAAGVVPGSYVLARTTLPMISVSRTGASSPSASRSLLKSTSASGSALQPSTMQQTRSSLLSLAEGRGKFLAGNGAKVAH